MSSPKQRARALPTASQVVKALRRSARHPSRATYTLRRDLGPTRDVTVVSFPKSGRTWLRVLLDRLHIALAYTHDTVDDPAADRGAYRDRRVVLLVRDPRDTVVSLYFQLTKRDLTFAGTLSELIRDERYGVEAILRFHRDWQSLAPSVRGLHVVRYEDMRADSTAALRDLLAFLGAAVPDEALTEAISFASFDRMREMEASGRFSRKYGEKLTPRDASDPESFKVRKGKVGGFVEVMSPDDIAYCNELLRRHRSVYSADIS